MSQFRQDNRFTGGMSSDINDLNQPSRTYKKAVNLFSKDYGNLTSLVREKSDLFADWGLYQADEPTDYNWVSAFRASALDPNDSGVEKEWIIAFMNLPTGGAIYQIDPGDPSRIFRLHTDALLDPVVYDRADYLVFDKDMDVSMYREGDQTYIFWVSKGSRPRCIVLVGDQSALIQHDVSAIVGDFLGIANVPDSLYIQPLAPGDLLNTEIGDDGSLLCGTYQVGYRYVNTNSGKVSAIGILSEPIQVVPGDPDRLNDIVGGGPGQVSSSSIVVSVASQPSYHRAFFNAIQFFVVEWLGNAAAIVKSMEPEEIDASWYAVNASGSIEKKIVGNEAYTVSSEAELLEIRATIEEARVLEERDGRLFLGNITYSNLKSGMTWQNNADVGTNTVQFESYVTSKDPLTGTAVPGVRNSLTSPYRGYRGGEVYRFGATYWNKFMEFSEPDVLKFDPATRPAVPNRTSNWASADCTDWKFPERHTSETSIMSSLFNGPTMFHIEIGVGGMPDWAMGCMILRRKRIRNIIAQTPVINAMSVSGVYHHIDPEIADDSTVFEKPWLSAGNYDTDGSKDTFEPKVLSYGHLKHINIKKFNGSVNPKKQLFYPLTELTKEKDFSGVDRNQDSTSNSMLYLYPLEFLANDNGEALYTDDLEGMNIEVFDCVMMSAYNAARTGESKDTLTGSNVLDGAASKYVWIFAPTGDDAYWSHNNVSLLKIFERGTNPYDNTIPVAPERAYISRAWTIGFGSLPTIVGEGHSNDDVVSSIDTANGLSELWSAQSGNEYSIFKNSDFRFPGSITNQRAILVSQAAVDGFHDTIPLIQDPLWFIYNYYQNGAGDYNLITGSGLPLIDSRAVSQPAAITDISGVDSISNPFMIPSGSGVPVFLANITRGLDDNRYGSDEREEWVSTGAAMILSPAFISIITPSPATLPVTVYGGDCIITRATIKIRDNAPVIATAEASDETDDSSNRKFLQYQGDYGDVAASNSDQIAKVTGYENYVEYMMLYMESEVNGFWFSRPQGSFPSGFTGRIANAADEPGFPDFTHSESIMSEALAPISYLYNFGYTKGGGLRTLFSNFNLLREIDNPFSRIHFTPQRVYEEWGFPFQRFLTGDFHDLPRSNGGITRLAKVGDDRMVAVQVDDIFSLFLGVALSEDADGRQFTLQSSRVIGSDSSVSAGTSKHVSAGAYTPGESISTPFGIFLFDRRRLQVFSVAGGVQPISDSRVQSLIENELLAGVDVDSQAQFSPRMFYEHSTRRLWVSNWNRIVGEFKAICYACDTQRWETVVHVSAAEGANEVNAIISTGAGEVAFTDNGTTGEMFSRRKGTDNGGLFGSEVESSVTFILNNTEHSSFPKVLKTVQIQGDGMPASVRAMVVRNDQIEQDSGQVILGKERRGTFIFSRFEDSGVPGTRIRGEQLEIVVSYSGTAPKSLESTQTTYRLDHRSKTR